MESKTNDGREHQNMSVKMCANDIEKTVAIVKAPYVRDKNQVSELYAHTFCVWMAYQVYDKARS